MSVAGSGLEDHERPVSLLSSSSRQAPLDAQGVVPKAQAVRSETKLTERGSKPLAAEAPCAEDPACDEGPPDPPQPAASAAKAANASKQELLRASENRRRAAARTQPPVSMR
jgi:hypothetical protein